jgi:hypothetical protein
MGLNFLRVNQRMIRFITVQHKFVRAAAYPVHMPLAAERGQELVPPGQVSQPGRRHARTRTLAAAGPQRTPDDDPNLRRRAQVHVPEGQCPCPCGGAVAATTLAGVGDRPADNRGGDAAPTW